MGTEVHERVAKIEQQVLDHLKVCDQGREENNAAHSEIKGMVKTVSARTWWIMGLIVAGMSTVTWTILNELRDQIGFLGQW
jgi:hypothetical protein